MTKRCDECGSETSMVWHNHEEGCLCGYCHTLNKEYSTPYKKTRALRKQIVFKEYFSRPIDEILDGLDIYEH